MEIKIAQKYGFCPGVKRSIAIVLDALNDDTVLKPIYILGHIVHNKYVTDALTSLGVITLLDDDKEKAIMKVNTGSIIISAHGISDELKTLILSRNINLIDSTCRCVINNMEMIKTNIEKYDYILLYGKANHPEVNALLPLSEKIILINEETDLNVRFKSMDKLLLTCITSVSYDILESIYAKYAVNLNIKLANEVCDVSRMRQMDLLQEAEEADVIIIVGDRLSNNTKTLAIIGELILGKKVIAIENAANLKSYKLNKADKIYLASGASTPNIIVEQVLEYLQSDGNNYRVLKNHHILDSFTSIKKNL